jgi:hypothetical protein
MLALLKERFPDYEIVELEEDFWDIVNPFGKENIGVYEEKFFAVIVDGKELPILPERSEYVIHFDTQHRHFEKKEDVFEYIESIMNDDICAVEFFAEEKPHFGGEIASCKLNGLTFETLSEEFRLFNNLLNTMFTIRSFSGKYDMNGRIENVDGKHTLIFENK